MTNPQVAANLINAGAQAIQDRAKDLGISWGLRMATVVSVTTGMVKAIYDGDTSTIPMTSMIGTLAPGERVYVAAVPPSGNFIVGRLNAYESGNEVISFTTQTTFTVDIAFKNPFVNAPRVFLNINSGVGATANWHVRAFNVAANQFRLFAFGPSATWVNVSVYWAAFAQ